MVEKKVIAAEIGARMVSPPLPSRNRGSDR
jgi:hypothetical protein